MKKLLSMFLVLAMLCTMFALAACEDKVDETSSEATSSEESVAPPTNAELLESAFNSLEKYETPFENVLAIDSEAFDALTGTENFVLSIDELTLMGESEIGDEPLKLTMKAETGADASKILGEISAVGDAVKIDVYTKGDKQYILFPELYEDSVFDLAEMASTEDSEDSEDTEDDTTESDSTLSDTMLDDIYALLLKEENISISEDGKLYTVTLGDADVDELMDMCMSILGAANGIPGLDGTTDESTETADPDSSVFVLDLSSESQAVLSCTIKEGETVLADVEMILSEANGTTTITCTGSAAETEVFSLTMTATDSAVNIEGEMNMNGILIEIALDVTNENDACTIDGSLSIIIDMNGMLLTIPFGVSGSIGVEGETTSMALALSASIEGMMTIGVSAEMDFTPGDVTVTLPFDESDVQEFDEEDFSAKMFEVYPNAAEMLFGMSGEYPDDLYSADYMNEDGSVSLTFYSDDTASLSLSDLTYEKTDDTVTLYKDGEAVFTAAYTLDDNGYYVLYGDSYETVTGNVEDDGYLVNFYMYYDDSTSLDIYLLDDSAASLSMCFFLDVESDDLVFLLPDGSTVTYEITMSEDDSSLTLFGETLNYLEW